MKKKNGLLQNEKFSPEYVNYTMLFLLLRNCTVIFFTFLFNFSYLHAGAEISCRRDKRPDFTTFFVNFHRVSIYTVG